MEFQTYFEISDFKFQVYLFPLGGVVFIILSSLIVKFPEKYIKFKDFTTSYLPMNILKFEKKTVRGFGIAILLFAFFWTSLAAGSLLKKQYELRKAYKTGKYSIIEGYVNDFSPMPYTGHQDEFFSINGVTFNYSDFKISPAFNNTKSHGGPVEEGAYLRVSYVDNDIIKLEKRNKN